jgi:hypothetical protein
MEEIEIDLRHRAKSPMLGSDAAISPNLRELNRIFGEAGKQGISIDLLTDDEMLDIEADLLVGRMAGSFPGTDEPIIKACDKYIALLRKKGMPETLIPKRDPSNPLRFLA